MSKETDILIPLGLGSRHDNLELRYCLRSIEKHLSGVGNIWLIGESPEWVQNCFHIVCLDNTSSWKRAENIYRKIMAGCNRPDLSDDFLFINDDHYLITDYVAGEFPYYHRGIIDLNNFVSNQPQLKQYSNTLKAFGNPGDILDFDVHSPILYNKRQFLETFHVLDSNWPEYGYAIKSQYIRKNMLFFEGYELTKSFIQCEDLKFTESLMKSTIYSVLEKRQWFSIGDKCLRSGEMKQVLQELYPHKSKYEL